MSNPKMISGSIVSILFITGFSFSAQASFYDDGLVAFSQGEHVHAAQLFQKAVTAGESGAEHMLMRLHTEGVGVAKDDKAAHKWALAAAEQGIMQSQFDVAEMYANGSGVSKNPAAAYEWFRKAAKQGHHVAYYRVAEMMEQGLVVKADAGEIKRLYLVAATEFDMHAQKGNVAAQTDLAGMYERGQGVEKNILLALHWYQKAAVHGYAVAQYHLGRLYVAADAVEYNKAEAAYWLAKAANQGFGMAKEMLTKLKEDDGPDMAMR